MSRAAALVVFRRLAEADLPLLHRWLNAPHVLEWWDRPGPTIDQVRAKYLPRVAGASDVTPYIICWAQVPIGYIQLYPVRPGSWGLPSVVAGAGLDLFIGDDRYVGRGLGSDILSKFLRGVVFRDEGVNVCFGDPSPRNRRAIRAFEKAGFCYFGTGTDPNTGIPVQVMRISRDDLAAPPRDRTTMTA